MLEFGACGANVSVRGVHCSSVRHTTEICSSLVRVACILDVMIEKSDTPKPVALKPNSPKP